MNIAEVKRVIEVSKQEKWPYPQTFQAFVEAGVTSYRTDLTDNVTVYYGDGDSYEDRHSTMAERLEIADRFQGDEVQKGLRHHQEHRTTYTDFLKTMAEAGVQYYMVDMASRKITYTSGRPDEAYTESVPV